MNREPWWVTALCRQYDPDMCFDYPTLARKICAKCPVANDCLEEALSLPQFKDNHGIRAGLTPTERNRLRQRRRINNAIVY